MVTLKSLPSPQEDRAQEIDSLPIEAIGQRLCSVTTA